MLLNTTEQKEIVDGSLVKIKGYSNNWIVVHISQEEYPDSFNGSNYKTLMQCINVNELNSINPHSFYFHIQDQSNMSANHMNHIEIFSKDVTVVGFKKIMKQVQVKYVTV